jgi:hypothetical protein
MSDDLREVNPLGEAYLRSVQEIKEDDLEMQAQCHTCRDWYHQENKAFDKQLGEHIWWSCWLLHKEKYCRG